MNLAQQLLVRAIIAAFWENPYKEKLTRWGTGLYDRFMLPHYVWNDLGDAIDELSGHGLSNHSAELKHEWYLPHYEFRFSKIAEMMLGESRVELRSAIEPWYLMGEEPSSGGTARFVDSSMERMQISVDGFDPARHAVLCNGRSIPMHPTGTVGKYIAGIKYRAWQPPRCLHPTIGVNVPLQFDLVDRRTHHSIGGCCYHVADPSGRSHEVFPVNAAEAESRRVSRIEIGTVTGGRLDIPDAPPSVEPNDCPVTFDLRRTR